MTSHCPVTHLSSGSSTCVGQRRQHEVVGRADRGHALPVPCVVMEDRVHHKLVLQRLAHDAADDVVLHEVVLVRRARARLERRLRRRPGAARRRSGGRAAAPCRHGIRRASGAVAVAVIIVPDIVRARPGAAIRHVGPRCGTSGAGQVGGQLRAQLRRRCPRQV